MFYIILNYICNYDIKCEYHKLFEYKDSILYYIKDNNIRCLGVSSVPGDEYILNFKNYNEFYNIPRNYCQLEEYGVSWGYKCL